MGRLGTGGLDSLWKITMAIGILRNTGTDPPQEAIGPLGPIASRGWSVNYVVDYK